MGYDQKKLTVRNGIWSEETESKERDMISRNWVRNGIWSEETDSKEWDMIRTNLE